MRGHAFVSQVLVAVLTAIVVVGLRALVLAPRGEPAAPHATENTSRLDELTRRIAALEAAVQAVEAKGAVRLEALADKDQLVRTAASDGRDIQNAWWA